MRRHLRRTGDKCPQISTLHLSRWQRGGDYFVSTGKSDLTASNLAYVCGKAAVDLVADHQKSQQCSFGARASVNRLDECLIKVMLPEPPVAAFSPVFFQ